MPSNRNQQIFEKLGGIARPAGPIYAPGVCFATISARARFVPNVEESAARAVRDAFLHPRRSRIERKREPVTLVRCEFHVGNKRFRVSTEFFR